MAPYLLLDGNSLAYRAFFALPTDMATASGQVTNAVFGFTSMLINLLKDHKPDRLAVAFDLPQPTFRHELVADYKAGRAEAPDILRQQMGLVRQVRRGAARSRSSRSPASRPTTSSPRSPPRPRDRGDDVIIVTGDRDAYQLVEDPHIRVLYNRRGVSDYARVRRGRHQGAHGRHARRSTRSTPRCGATRATTCPACPAWARRRRPSSSTTTATSTASSPTSTS